MEKNPYTNRNAIQKEEDFFGRERELRQAYSRLLNGTSVYLYGERRTGKSSLMNALNFPSERESLGVPDNVRFAYADCQEIAGCDDQTFLAYLCSQYAMALNLEEPSDPSRAAFKNLGRQAQARGWQPVLALDEFEVVVESPRVTPEFLAFLRSWSTATSTPILIASREGATDKLNEDNSTGSAFLNMFATVYVGPLEPGDAIDLITRPAGDIGEPFEQDEVEWIGRMGGLWAFFLQMACCHLLEARRTHGRGKKARQEAETNFRYDASVHLKYLTGRLTPAERSALQDWLGQRKGSSPEGYDGLLRKGILIRDTELRVFSPAFQDMFQLSCAQ